MNYTRCLYCNKLISNNNIKKHIKSELISAMSFYPKEKIIPWNKGLTKENSEKMRQISDSMKDGYQNGREVKTPNWNGRKHSGETKDKISKSRTKYLEENPDKVPYLLNHYSKGESYPEQYFREVFENRGIEFQQEVREGLYSLDFVIGNTNIEIDGDQHYVDQRIVESDIRRNEYMTNLGYSIKRVRWSEYQKLKKEEKIKFIDNLLECIL